MMTWIVADTEDNSRELLSCGKSGFDKRITQISALCSDGTNYYSLGNVVEFLDWCNSKGHCKVYFHNLQYDLGNLFGKALDLARVDLVKGRLIRARFNKLLFHDSFNLWPESAERIGKSVGLEKLPFDANSKEYCMRDVEIIAKGLEQIRTIAAKLGIEELPATIGSLSIKIWHAMGGRNEFCDWKGARQGYYGGRVELFRRSCTGNINYYDYNSLYPWAMTQQFPSGPLQSTKDIENEGISEVEITVPKTSYVSSLPMRDNAGRTFYPVGTLRGIWTNHEIRRAIHSGARLRKVHSAVESNTCSAPYRDYIQKLFSLRTETKSPSESQFFKLLMNNAYGQLAMDGIVSVSKLRTPETECEGTCYGSRVLCDVQMPLPEHVNYMHAAYITAYARGRLLDALEQVPQEDLIYCDTDSVIMKGNGPWQCSKDLGAFKHEATWSHIRCHAPKIYDGEENGHYTAKAKGVPRRLAKEFIEHKYTEWDQPFKLREAIVGYDASNANQLSVWHKVNKHLRSEYDKKKLVDGRYFPLVI